MKLITLLSLTLGVLLLGGTARAETLSYRISVAAGPQDRSHTPIKVVLALPASFKAESVQLKDASGREIPAQVTGLSLQNDGEDDRLRELHFILPPLKAGESLPLTATLSDRPNRTSGFEWRDTPNRHSELRHGDRPVMRYMYEPLDESSPARREQTYKVFHHLYDPSGKRLLTKGPGGQFTHHRGIFYGFNKVSYGDGKKADVWHATGDAYQGHAKLISSEAGPVLGRHRVLVEWHGPGKEVFAREERELTAYNVPGGQLIEFASRLHSAGEKIRLDGDPQHAGFHFRADNEVSEKTAKQTYYLRPDGKGKPGETRNWPNDKKHVNLPWNAMSFVLGDRRYTALYLDHPANPKEARFSERDYGRFGSYFEYDLTPEEPLDVRYRLWVQEDELTVEEAKNRSGDFVSPPTVTVSRLP